MLFLLFASVLLVFTVDILVSKLTQNIREKKKIVNLLMLQSSGSSQMIRSVMISKIADCRNFLTKNL